MIDLATLMAQKPGTLAKTQATALKSHILDVLDKLTQHIKNGEYDAAKAMTFYSPAGDGYGSGNDCINFSYTDGSDMDIYMALSELISLEHMANPVDSIIKQAKPKVKKTQAEKIMESL